MLATGVPQAQEAGLDRLKYSTTVGANSPLGIRRLFADSCASHTGCEQPVLPSTTLFLTTTNGTNRTNEASVTFAQFVPFVVVKSSFNRVDPNNPAPGRSRLCERLESRSKRKPRMNANSKASKIVFIRVNSRPFAVQNLRKWLCTFSRAGSHLSLPAGLGFR